MSSTKFNFICFFLLVFLSLAAKQSSASNDDCIDEAKRNSKVKDENFECGIESLGNARIPFSVKYFLVAILFVLFDVEVIFLYPWAVNFKDLGMEGMIKMVIFMLLLLVGFFYIVKKKALVWE